MAFQFTPLELARITHGYWLNDSVPTTVFGSVFTDSRNFLLHSDALFFAIVGTHYNGHHFCVDLAQKGQQFFVVSTPLFLDTHTYQLVVPNTLKALQSLASAHRSQFKGEVIGITGSNGKTIVKEWLFELLSGTFNVYKSPKSYNSQIGVALSLLQAPIDADFYLIEAGISQKGEMQNLEEMIRPEWGVFTHLGSAHSEGFSSDQDKFYEKSVLFERSVRLIIPQDLKDKFVLPTHLRVAHKLISVGNNADCDISLQDIGNQLLWNETVFTCPFSDKLSIHNIRLAIAVSLSLGVSASDLQARLDLLRSVPMRLEWMEGYKGSTILNDSWTNDPDALQYALAFLFQVKKQSKTCVILSDYPEASGSEIYVQAARMILDKKPDLFIGIGPLWLQNKAIIPLPNTLFFPTTQACLDALPHIDFSETAILIKGSRNFSLDKIARSLQVKQHDTQLEIHLDKLLHNFEILKQLAGKECKMMAMVKAFAYGSGEYEVAKVLENKGVDYFSVAFLDEGVALRQAGIKTPIMVLNPGKGFDDAWHAHNIEPAIGSLSILHNFAHANMPLSVHIELDTGMHRLGFQKEDLSQLVSLLNQNPQIQVKSIFTHLAAAEDPQMDEFTSKQQKTFFELCYQIIEAIGYKPLLHLSNSAALLRKGNFGGSMVRPGLALYGYGSNEDDNIDLLPVFAFKTHITQIKKIAAGEGIGYGLHSVSEKERTIAILPVGYADGFSRKFSQGAMYVGIKSLRAPVVGNVCMDMCMVDVTEIPCQEGDEVTLFGETIGVNEWSKVLNSIPYEVFTSISQRVRRVFISEK